MKHIPRTEVSGIFLYASVIGVAVGIGFGLVFNLGLLSIVGLLCVASVSLFISRTRKYFLLCVIFAASISLGLVRSEFFLWHESQLTVSHNIGASVSVAGTVSADPDVRATTTHVVVDAATINGEVAHGKILAMVPPTADVSYGDTVMVHGLLEKSAPFDSEGGRVFDYPGYLRVQGIYATMQRATITSDNPSRFSPIRILFDAKHAFEYSLEQIFPQPTASIMEGVLLGERKGLPTDIEQILVAAGLIHIVILAGYALSLVAQGVLDALSFVRPKWRYIIAALLLIAFVVMTGAAATTVRACLMAIIAMLARYLHRNTVALRSLTAVFVAMILWNPLYLLFDESFIISVLATFGLVMLGSWCEQVLRFLPERFDLRGIASSTMSVQIFALPAILYYTGTLSLYALPANVLALPALPLVMLFSFCAGVLGFVHPLLALLPAALANFFLHWIMFIATIAAAAPLGGATIPAFPIWVMIAVYAPLFWFAIRTYRRGDNRVAKVMST